MADIIKSFRLPKPHVSEDTRNKTALLEILARGMRQVEDGRVRPARDVIRKLRKSR